MGREISELLSVLKIRDSSTSVGMTEQVLDMTKKLFAELDVYREAGAHSPAMNMAIDEGLLSGATVPAIRFYRWQSPALSFGYFGRFADVASYQGERELVRRWTGGGTVMHGVDLTYSLVIPISDAAFRESSMALYEKIHRCLVDALSGNGKRAASLAVAAVCDRRSSTSGRFKASESAVADRRYSDCFANAVHADVMIDGRKVAGAAQRRTRRGLLQQGSIQGIELHDNLTECFAQALSANYCERKLGEEVLNRARELAEQKYGTEAWLLKR